MARGEIESPAGAASAPVRTIFCADDPTADQAADQLLCVCRAELTVHSLYMEVLQQEREFNDMRRMLSTQILYSHSNRSLSLLTRECALLNSA
jgi:hypothetical protein